MINRLTMPNKLSIFIDEVIHMQENPEKEITLDQLLARVKNCGAEELEPVMDALRYRYKQFCVGWEVILQAYPIKQWEEPRKPQLTLLPKQKDT